MFHELREGRREKGEGRGEKMVNGQWSMVNGQWSMVNGQWSMVNGPTPLTTHHSPLTTHHSPLTRRGFTLIEMMVVLAILGILFGLLFIPLVKSFHFVRSEEDQIALQKVNRDTMRSITGDLALALQVTNFPLLSNGGVLAGNPTRVDLVLPVTASINQPPGATAPAGATGSEPGPMRETFFVGLANPTEQPSAQYSNPIAQRVTGGGFANAGNGVDNEYIIWRAIYNPQDTNDPVYKAISNNGAQPPNYALLNDPWFFDDSLKTAVTQPNTPYIPTISAAKQALLTSMLNYTARLSTNGIPVGSELTPVAITGQMDAVRSRWVTPPGGWIIDPRVNFLPAASQSELMARSEYGTQMQSSRGQWVTGSLNSGPLSGAVAANAMVYNNTPVFWASSANQYVVPSPGNAGATVGPFTAPNGDVIGNVRILNGPAAGQIVNQATPAQPYFIDPRTGRVTFTQFQATETISVLPFVSVYPLTISDPISDNNNPNVAQLTTANGPLSIRPQILPFSDSLTVLYHNPNGNPPIPQNYQRVVGNLLVTNHNADTNANNAFEVAYGVYSTVANGAGNYAINYVGNPELAAITPPGAWDQPFNGNYQLGQEVPLIQIPWPAADPNISPWNPPANPGTGTQVVLSFKFTFSTLGIDGQPLAAAQATYSSQRFVHVSIGFRKYDEQDSTPHDYSLATSVGSANRIDEQPNAE